MFEKGLAYRAINVHRATISAYYEPLHGFPIGQSPFDCILLPPQPRYTFIWDVETTFCYLKSLPAQKDLSDKAFTLKLTMILAVTPTSRCSEISYLNIKFMTMTKGKYIFSFNKLTNACSRSNSQSTLNFQGFEQDTSLCVVS